MINRILDALSVVLFFAMVPLLPVTWLAMYIIMETLGLIGL